MSKKFYEVTDLHGVKARLIRSLASSPGEPKDEEYIITDTHGMEWLWIKGLQGKNLFIRGEMTLKSEERTCFHCASLTEVMTLVRGFGEGIKFKKKEGKKDENEVKSYVLEVFHRDQSKSVNRAVKMYFHKDSSLEEDYMLLTEDKSQAMTFDERNDIVEVLALKVLTSRMPKYHCFMTQLQD